MARSFQDLIFGPVSTDLPVTMDPLSSVYSHAIHRRQAIIRLLRLASLIAQIIVVNVAAIIRSRYYKEPWHTSALTGQMWVLELLAEHPECIRTELGVHRHVFYALINPLREKGHTDSKYVTLEEQLAIFLYCSVTGLTVRHLGERFQRSNDTITRCAPLLLLIDCL